jgi:hypothetical protein
VDSTQVSPAGPESVRVRADEHRPVRAFPGAVDDAWLVAAMWSSLKVVDSDKPRWREVPNATACSGSDGSGWPS